MCIYLMKLIPISCTFKCVALCCCCFCCRCCCCFEWAWPCDLKCNQTFEEKSCLKIIWDNRSTHWNQRYYRYLDGVRVYYILVIRFVCRKCAHYTLHIEIDIRFKEPNADVNFFFFSYFVFFLSCSFSQFDFLRSFSVFFVNRIWKWV